MDITRKNPNANGLAVIISNDYKEIKGSSLRHLHGAERDSEKMKETFKFLKFAVLHVHNYSIGDLMAILQAAAGHRYPPSYRRIAVVFSGHGISGHIYTGDGKELDLKDIFDQFSISRTPNLGGISRLFFIDACRGNEKNKGVIVPRGGELIKTTIVPVGGNILIAYSTILHYMSYETPEGGIWMTKLADKLKTDSSICDILTNINSELVSEFCRSTGKTVDVQQPTFHSQLNEIINLYSEAHAGVSGPSAIEIYTPHSTTDTTSRVKSIPKKKQQSSISPQPPIIPQLVCPPLRHNLIPSVGDRKIAPSTQGEHEAIHSTKRPVKSVKEQATGGASVKSKDKKLLSQNARDRLSQYTDRLGRPKPSYEAEKVEGNKYKATVYVAQIGRVSGQPRKSKSDAEEAAATEMLSVVGIKF